MALGITEDITELIGKTPLLRLRSVVPPGAANVYAKLEYLNPGGSIKDRAALGLITDAERRGLLAPGATIIEPTAGNTGVGLALIGRTRGYRVILCVPEGYSREKMQVAEALGGTLVYTPSAEGIPGAIRKALELAETIPNSFVPQQFSNPANPHIHYMTTGAEIHEQLGGKVDGLAIGCGTAGTFSGVARYIRERNPQAVCVAVETEGSVLGGGQPGPHKVEGIGTSFIPENFHRDLCDEIVAVTDRDAFAMVRRLAAEEGVLCGGSAGANAFAAIQLAIRLGEGKRVVTIFPDGAERYMSKGIFDEVS
ncbi:MAG: cysteine synthase [Chloracidobacterium sp. CP2_5A]|nr:MAG: cysteine synthase [Chloracidobacterium sp. CP2_5A]